MKTTKQTLLSIAIIAALPFASNATQTVVETNTPAAVGANGTVKKAAATGPYQTASIGEHDDEHIATTAYVKGAYNDAIAAVNKVDDSKQDQLYYGNTKIVGIQNRDEFTAAVDDGLHYLFEEGSGGASVAREFLLGNGVALPTADITAEGILQAAAMLYDKIQTKRVGIYTTWGDDTAVTGVALQTQEDFW